MLVGALGCNLAWGLIDGIMYLMACLTEQARVIKTVREVRRAEKPEAAHGVLVGALPPFLASALERPELERMRQLVARLPEPPARPRWRKEDLWGALAVFLWVFVSTLPVVVPFIFMQDVTRALRVSNGVAIAMLFLCGYAFGRCAGHRPWLMGLGMVLLGSVLVSITIALGG
jgi:VIT1/CCC1 family predicted Fe2+/Mn2+ transporter